MKRKFTQFIDDAGDTRHYFVGIILLFLLLLIAHVAGAQTITSVSPTCTSVGEGVTLTINGSNFSTGIQDKGSNKGQGNVKVTILDNTGVPKYNSILEAYSASEINNIVLAASAFNTAGTYTIQVANRDNTGSGFFAPVSFSFEVYPKLIIGTPNGPTSVCASSTNNYSIDVPGAKTYEWSIISGNATIASGGSAATATVNFGSTAGSVRIGVRAFNQCDYPTGVKFIDVVVALPTLQITNPVAVCSPGTVDLTANAITAGSTSGLTFSYWANAGATTPLSAPSAVTSSGTYYIKGTNSTTGCYVIKPVTVTINPLPSLVITDPTAVCSPGTINLTANTITVGSTSGLIFTYWRDISATDALPSPSSVSTSGTYYIKGTNPSTGCSVVKPVTVTVNPTPELSSTVTATVCSGTSFNYTATSTTAGVSFSWSRSAVTGISPATASGNSATINETLTNSTVNPVVVSYSVTMSANGCSNTQDVEVTVNPLPVLSSDLTPAAICSGATFVYTATSETSGVTFSWSRTAVAGISGSTAGTGNSATINETLINTTDNPIDVTYVITASANNCDGPPQNVTVRVNPIPALSSATSATICSGSAFNYTATSATAGATFSWSRSAVTGVSNTANNGNSASISETIVNITSNPVVVTYNVTMTSNGCSNSETVVVTVNPSPTLSSPLTATICSGTTFDYTATSTTVGVSFSWSRASVTGISPTTASGSTAAISETLTNSTVNPVVVTYSITMTADGCSNTQDVKVTVNPSPVLTSTLSPGAVCNGSAFSYKPSSATAGVTFSWTRHGDAFGNLPANGSGDISETLNNTSDKPITVIYLFTTTTANGCSGTVQSVSVTVNPSPKLTGTLATTVCSGQLFSYFPWSQTPGAIFSWKRAVVAGISNSAANGNGNINETLINTTTSPVNVTYEITTSANGCTGPTENYIVTVNPQPSAVITPTGPTSFCQDGGNSVTLNAPAGNGLTYEWFLNGGASAVSTAQNLTVTNPGTYNYVLRVKNALGCTTTSAPMQVKVVQLDANVANITYSGSTELCEGETLLLQAVENSNYLYQWNDDNGPISGANTAKFYATASGNYSVTIEAKVDGETCIRTSDPIEVTVTPELFNTLSSGDLEICSGEVPTEITGNAATGGEGTGSYTYLWESSTSSSSSGFTAATGTNNGVSYEPVALTKTTWFRRLVTSGNCEVYSDPIKITVTPVITNNTLTITDKTICTGQTAPTLTARLPSGGNGTYTYQWEQSTDSGDTFTAINGATAQDYAPGILTATTIFRRIAFSGACETPSGNVKIIVTKPITNYDVTANQTICSGGAPATLTGTPTGGSGSYTYQWERSTDGVTFAAIGATSQEYTPGNLTVDTWYRRKISSGNCSEYSNTVKITVTPPIGNTISTATVRTCSGDAVPELIANPATGGDGAYTYTWESSTDGTSFTAIGGATAQTYVPGNLTQTTLFRRKVESGACTSYSAVVKVEVTPVIENNEILTSDFSVCYDTYPGQLTGSVATGGNGNITYHWEYSTTSATEGFSLTGYDWLQNHSPGSLKQTTWYRRRATSGSCETVSNVVKITVTPAVANHTISGTSVYCLGATATALTGTFEGGSTTVAPTYRWQQSTSSSGPWADIAGATGAEYIPSTATVGKVYYRRLVNSDGCTDKASQPFAVTVNPIPAVNAVSSFEYCSGIAVAGISFGSSVSGTAYTWTSTVDVGFGTGGMGNIAGYTTKNSGTTALTTTVTVTPSANGCTGTPMSFTIKINPKPTVTVSSASVCPGGTATITATPSGGTSPYSNYSWTVPAGATNPGNVSSFTASVAGNYSVVITDSKTCSSANGSGTLSVKTVPAVSISGVSDGQVVYSGQSSITLTGSPTGGTWSWPGRKTNSGNTFNPCDAFATAPAGATELNVIISYTITSNGCQNTATKTIKIKKSKYNVVVFSNIKPFCQGDNVTHRVSVYRDATVIYPYLVDANGDPVRADGSPVGQNELPVWNPNYPYPAGTSEIAKRMSFRYFQPIVTGGELIPANQFTYEWTKNQDNSIGNKQVDFSNAGLSSLEYYASYVSGSLCGVTFNKKLSYRAYGAVLDSYNIAVSVSKNPLCPGDPTTFTANLDAGFMWDIANLTMIWKLRRGSNVYTIKTVQGTNTLGLTSAEIEAALAQQGVSPAKLIDNDQIFIDFTSDVATTGASGKCNGNATTTPIVMRVNDIIPTTPTLQNPVVCIGSTVTFTAPVSPTGTAQVTYTWTVGSGANARTYTTNTNQLIITADGSFTPDVTYPVSVVVSNGCVTTQSLALGSITVNTPPSISVQPVPVRICEGTRTVFSITAAGSGITYQWLKNGQPISGATSSTYVIESPVKVDEGTYSVQIIGTTACGNLTSQGATLTIDQPATITTNLPSAGQTVCLGGTATYTVNATGTDLQFSWFKAGGVPVTNGGRFTIQSTATSSTLTITNVEAGDAGNYYVVVSNSTATACNLPLNSFEVPLVVNPLPVAKTILGGPYCPIDEPNGATISVENSESGITYSLMQGGTVLATLAGDGTTKAFPGTYKEGTYTVSATNTSTTCGNSSVGQTTVTVTDVPVVNGELQITWINNKTQWEIVALSDYADKSDLVYSWYIGAGATEPTLVTSTNTIVIDNTDPELYVKCLITSSLGRCVPDLELNNEEVVPLPVEIIYLTAEKQGSDVVLKWATAMEKDNTGFEVQVSNDGDNFRKITFVPTRNGNSSMKQLYEYKDIENGKHGTRYYRLKQLDASGTFEYFGPKVVEFGSVSDNIKVYPNPFLNEVNLSIEAEQDGEVEIVFSNAVGRQIIKTTVQVEKGLNTEQILLDMTLPRGVYFITTRMGSVTNHFKLLKQ
ncbi:PKD-like domain-containing protein [Pontibacter sp. MBLB2868]|uniref:PKD-like domain-containing protein n=1 Tax=Pontibacter sp. MBLB2868 TaxID=3451555 RepID=UPI003F74D9E5